MSVGLGELIPLSGDARSIIEVAASNYDANEAYLIANTECADITLFLDRKQLQELSVIIDRFLS